MAPIRRRSALTAHLVSSAGAGEPPRVLEDLRQTILAGHGPPGTAIPIDTVAAFFGVSSIPVREALKTLQAEGLVDHVPRGGYHVATLAFEEFRELYAVRRALEMSALRVAVPRASGEDVAALRGHHAALQAASGVEDAAAYHRATRDFHRGLIAPAGMPRLLSMYDRTWNMTEAVRPMARVTHVERAALFDEHAAIIDALDTGDVEATVAAAEAHYEHLDAALTALREDEWLFRT